jgi:hypothetical protein
MNRPPLDQRGWLEHDRIAETLKPVLRIMADGVPMLLDATRKIDEWAAANPKTDPPRVIGLYESQFRESQISQMCRPYSLWMVQRPLDAYAALSEAERKPVDAALAGTGWEALLACHPRHRVGKRANELVLEG